MATNDRVPLGAFATSGCDCGRSTSVPRMRVRKLLPVLPAFVLVVLPKCPLCLLAWFGILGSMEVNSWVNDIWGTPLAFGLLSVAVCVLLLRARRNRNWRPFVLGLLGSAALLAGKCLIDAPPLVYAGLGL